MSISAGCSAIFSNKLTCFDVHQPPGTQVMQSSRDVKFTFNYILLAIFSHTIVHCSLTILRNPLTAQVTASNAIQ